MHPILVSIGPLRLYSYGVLVAIGVLSAVLLIRKNAMQIALNSDVAVDLAITTAVSGFVGARIFYVIQFWNYFRSSPLDVFKIWEGGIILYGGLIGGLLGFTLFTRLKHLSFLTMLDLFVPALALAQGFGRIGCFLNGCCFGKLSMVPWSVSFPFLDHPVHPTQLYEAIFCFALVVFLLFLRRKHLKPGAISAIYFTLYPIGRFIIEYFRGDNIKFLFNLTLPQWTSILFLLITFISVLEFRFFRLWKKND